MNFLKTNRTETNGSLVLVPQALLESLALGQQKILELLENKPAEKLTGDYVAEEDAKTQFGKGTTWFWEKRKTGVLSFVKVGGKVYYHRSELLRLFQQ